MPSILRTTRPPSDLADKSIVEAYNALRSTGARVVSPEGRSRKLPPSLHNFLLSLVTELSAKRPVALLHGESTLTTVQASRLLSVSRQHLVNLLENGALPFHKVGTHRRIYAIDLFRYKEARDQKRRQAISDFASLERTHYLDS